MRKEWRRHGDHNVESAKSATAQQCEGSCDERQERKSPDGRWSPETGQGSSHDSEYSGRDEWESVAVTYSTDESREEVRYHPHCDIHTLSFRGTWEFRANETQLYMLVGKNQNRYLLEQIGSLCHRRT
jgi:hypothetical protein